MPAQIGSHVGQLMSHRLHFYFIFFYFIFIIFLFFLFFLHTEQVLH